MGGNGQEMLAPVIRKHLNIQMIRTRIETPRLLLRDWVEEDALSVLAVFGNEEVVRWTGAVPIPDMAHARQWVGMSNHYQAQHGVQEWAVVERASGEVVGACGLGYFDGQLELGLAYHFAPKVWGMGYATEAVTACLLYAWQAGYPAVVALTDGHNEASQHVLERCGFTRTGMVRIEDGGEAVRYVATPVEA